MKHLKLNTLYSIVENGQERIVKVIDHCIDHHTRKRDYLLLAVSPKYFKAPFSGELEQKELWVNASYIPSTIKELEASHPARILYGRK